MKLPYFTTLLLIAACACRAQTSEKQLNLKTPPANISIDGDIKEWGDSLSYYSPEERISYDIANSKDTLYIAIKIYDRTEIARILHAGLTITIDPKGKKKESLSVTYPLNVQPGAPMFSSPLGEDAGVSEAERDELQRERLTTLRGIKVTGFKDVEDDMITTSNTYGFQGAVSYDAAGDLIYEEAIPLIFFHADNAAKNLWSVNIKINGIQHPAGGGNTAGGGGGFGGGHRGGGGGGGHRGGGHHGAAAEGNSSGNTEMSKSVDFWAKFYLAK